MTDSEMLKEVKDTMGITHDFQDTQLKPLVREVQFVLVDSGIPKDVVTSEESVGVISRGVSDLWNFGAGGTSLSPYFFQRAAQLALRVKKVGEENV